MPPRRHVDTAPRLIRWRAEERRTTRDDGVWILSRLRRSLAELWHQQLRSCRDTIISQAQWFRPGEMATSRIEPGAGNIKRINGVASALWDRAVLSGRDAGTNLQGQGVRWPAWFFHSHSLAGWLFVLAPSQTGW